MCYIENHEKWTLLVFTLLIFLSIARFFIRVRVKGCIFTYTLVPLLFSPSILVIIVV